MDISHESRGTLSRFDKQTNLNINGNLANVGKLALMLRSTREMFARELFW